MTSDIQKPLKELKVDDKWSILYDQNNNDRPMMVRRHGEPAGSFDQDNMVVAMFYALLELTEQNQTVISVDSSIDQEALFQAVMSTVKTHDQVLEDEQEPEAPELITKESSAADVLFYTDYETAFPHFHKSVTEGRVLNMSADWEGAQERVILRRHIRKYWPEAGQMVCLSETNKEDLMMFVDELSGTNERKNNAPAT